MGGGRVAGEEEAGRGGDGEAAGGGFHDGAAVFESGRDGHGVVGEAAGGLGEEEAAGRVHEVAAEVLVERIDDPDEPFGPAARTGFETRVDGESAVRGDKADEGALADLEERGDGGGIGPRERGGEKEEQADGAWREGGTGGGGRLHWRPTRMADSTMEAMLP